MVISLIFNITVTIYKVAYTTFKAALFIINSDTSKI